jgi:transposase
MDRPVSRVVVIGATGQIEALLHEETRAGGVPAVVLHPAT